MKILVFLHGTAIMHKGAVGRTREERVKQVLDHDKSIYAFASYVPVDNSVRKLQAWREQGAESVLYFCVNSEVSATYGAAESARQLMPEKDIHVVDTLSLSMGQGFMILAAAEAVQAGNSVPEILSLVDGMRERTYLYAVLPTLKYLAMSGRVGQVAAGFADIISIKPVLTIKDGKLDLLERVRTLKKAYARAIDLCVEAIDSRPVERLAIVHVRAEAEAPEFNKQFTQAINYSGDVLYTELTPGLSVHSGAGMVGACFVVSD